MEPIRQTVTILRTRAETARWGEALGARLAPFDVIAIRGDLGAGKTTLTQALARGMGIAAPVTSPTFTLIHEYAGPVPMFHLDPYRLSKPEAMADLGFDEYLERPGVMVIEWADRIESLLPDERLDLALSVEAAPDQEEAGEDAPRRLEVTGRGARYAGLLDALQNETIR